MIQRGSGVVIPISQSSTGLPLPESTPAYAAAKAALTTYIKALSKEVGPKACASPVSPGWIYTTAGSSLVTRLAEYGRTAEASARRAS